jgi:hypothetical protein
VNCELQTGHAARCFSFNSQFTIHNSLFRPWRRKPVIDEIVVQVIPLALLLGGEDIADVVVDAGQFGFHLGADGGADLRDILQASGEDLLNLGRLVCVEIEPASRWVRRTGTSSGWRMAWRTSPAMTSTVPAPPMTIPPENTINASRTLTHIRRRRGKVVIEVTLIASPPN